MYNLIFFCFYVQENIGLLCGGGRILERIALYGRTTEVWCFGRYFEGSDSALFQTEYPKFPRQSWGNHEKQDRIIRDSNWALTNTIIFLPLAGLLAHL
jgi:hypothetical protein